MKKIILVSIAIVAVWTYRVSHPTTLTASSTPVWRIISANAVMRLQLQAGYRLASDGFRMEQSE